MSQNWYSKQIYGFSMADLESSLTKMLNKTLFSLKECVVILKTEERKLQHLN